VFGKYFLVQRCRLHKIQNVMSCLSPEEHPGVRRTMLDAYGAKDYKTAKKQLVNLQQALSRRNENL